LLYMRANAGEYGLCKPLQAPEKSIFTVEYFYAGKRTQNEIWENNDPLQATLSA